MLQLMFSIFDLIGIHHGQILSVQLSHPFPVFAVNMQLCRAKVRKKNEN